MTTNSVDQDKVLNRIRKMMALANDAAASAGERDNAMRMVHATLAKHNLTMAMAEASGQQQEEARDKGTTETRDQPWARRVAHSISDLYFCRYFFTKVRDGRGKVRHNFVGRVGNVETAKLMTDYVCKSIMSEANRLWKLQPDPGPWWTGFCKGAAEQIAARCLALRTDAEKVDAAQPSTGTALVLASFYKIELAANEEWLLNAGQKLYSVKNREKAAGAGVLEGRAFGAKVSLNRQVGTSAKSNLVRIK